MSGKSVRLFRLRTVTTGLFEDKKRCRIFSGVMCVLTE